MCVSARARARACACACACAFARECVRVSGPARCRHPARPRTCGAARRSRCSRRYNRSERRAPVGRRSAIRERASGSRPSSERIGAAARRPEQASWAMLRPAGAPEACGLDANDGGSACGNGAQWAAGMGGGAMGPWEQWARECSLHPPLYHTSIPPAVCMHTRTGARPTLRPSPREDLLMIELTIPQVRVRRPRPALRALPVRRFSRQLATWQAAAAFGLITAR